MLEFTIGANPRLRDTDGDFAPDGEEHDENTDPLSPQSAPLALLPFNRDLYASFAWHGSFSNGLYHHSLHPYAEDPAASFPWPMQAVVAPGLSDISGLPVFDALDEQFDALVVFPQQPPFWFLQQARPGAAFVTALWECGVKEEGGAYLGHKRVWVRGAAPEDADLFVPVEIRTFSMPFAGNGEPLSVTTKWLRIPAGKNVSEDYADALSGFDPYYPWAGYSPVTTHAYWDEPDPTGWRQEVHFVATPTGKASLNVKVVTPSVTPDGRFKLPRKDVETKTLRVAKLVPVLDDKSPPGIHVPLRGHVPPNGNDPGVPISEQISPGNDPDHFRIIVSDPNKRGKNPRIRITTQCNEAGFTAYSDSASTGDKNCVEMEDQAGVGNERNLHSPSMILTSDDTDDDHPIDGIVDDDLNDRSRKVALGGKVKIELVGWTAHGVTPQIEIDVRKDKTLTVYAVVMNDSPWLLQGQASATQKVMDDIRRVNERFAQIGIRVNLDNNGGPEFKAPPAAGSHVDYLQRDPNNTNLRLVPSNLEAVALLARPAVQPPVINPDVTLVYCKGIEPTENGPAMGFGMFPLILPNRQDLWDMVIVDPTHDDYLVAHELGHCISRNGHWWEDYSSKNLWTAPNSWPMIVDTHINLMRTMGKWRDVSLAVEENEMPAKRLNFIEQREFLKHPKLQ